MVMLESLCGSTIFCVIQGMMNSKYMPTGTSINSQQYWQTLKELNKEFTITWDILFFNITSLDCTPVWERLYRFVTFSLSWITNRIALTWCNQIFICLPIWRNILEDVEVKMVVKLWFYNQDALLCCGECNKIAWTSVKVCRQQRWLPGEMAVYTWTVKFKKVKCYGFIRICLPICIQKIMRANP